ncbi:MAG TPA: peptidoglycan DD-metalloendopeptidase family protein [Candidatus Limnocylindrales bacterium]|nr:peptidoglycan DD-metalloendopeptidase family protein [Candidatus Limnocylindrales bacterium]
MIRRSTPFEGWSTSRSKRSRRLRRLTGLLLLPLLVGVLGVPAINTPAAHADELSDAKAKQAALSKQIKDQKAAIEHITELQSDLNTQIAATKKELAGINADLAAVRKSIDQMVVRIEAVKKQYFALVAHVQLLENQLANVIEVERLKRSELGTKKAELAGRIREAYDTDRTTLLETFLAGKSFTDVISEVSYINDFAEHDKELAEQIVATQRALATIHATVVSTQAQTEALRDETLAQKQELDRQLVELKAAQERLKELEAETALALKLQRDAMAELVRNKKDLAKAIATTQKAQRTLAAKIDDLVKQQFKLGNIPSRFNGTLRWPMSGVVSGEFGCSSYAGYGPGNGCEHFHNGIDIVSPKGCGAPIVAAGDGRIGYIGWNYADGADPAWIVIIVHSQDVQTWYAHMKAHTFPGGIHAGSLVKAGQLIGYESATGHATGCHLHWMVEYNGQFRNPRLFV